MNTVRGPVENTAEVFLEFWSEDVTPIIMSQELGLRFDRQWTKGEVRPPNTVPVRMNRGILKPSDQQAEIEFQIDSLLSILEPHTVGVHSLVAKGVDIELAVAISGYKTDPSVNLTSLQVKRLAVMGGRFFVGIVFYGPFSDEDSD